MTVATGGSGASFLRDEGDKRTPMEACTLIASLEEAIAQGKVVDVPGLLGELERLKAMLWSRMVTVSCPAMSHQLPDTSTFLTLPQVATRLAIPEGRAYELARQGQLPIVRVGKYVRVPLAEFETWVRLQTSLERPIDRASAGFHSVLARKKKPEKQKHPLTGASVQRGASRRQSRGRASSKGQTNRHVDQPEPMTPCSTVELAGADTVRVHEEQ